MGTRALLLAALLAVSLPAPGAVSGTGVVSGQVTDLDTGEPLPGVHVVLLPDGETVDTDARGRFRFDRLLPGPYSLQFLHVGHRTHGAGPFDVGPDRPILLEIALERHTLTETVTVRPAVPEEPEGRFPSEMTRDEILRAAGTLDDPFRALTALPGVSSTNDRQAEIRLRGGEPQDTLFLLDGVVMESPYHFRGARGSAAAVNADAFDRFTVRNSGIGPELGNTVSGFIEMAPSEDGRDGIFFESALGTLATRVTAGGPLPQDGSWLAAARYTSLELYQAIGILDVEDGSPPDFGDLYLRARQRVGPGLDLVVGALGFNSDAEQFRADGELEAKLNAQTWVTYTGFDCAREDGLTWSARLSRTAFQQRSDGRASGRVDAGEERLAAAAGVGGPLRGSARWEAGAEVTLLSSAIEGVAGIGGPPSDFAAATDRQGAYVGFDLAPAPAWRLELGLRVDRDGRHGWAPLQPRVRAERAGPSWVAHVAAARYAQYPRFDQEFLAVEEPLAVSVADELSGGIAFRPWSQLEITATAFRRWMQDITAERLNLEPELAEVHGRFESGITDGLELAIRRDRGRVQASLAATLLRATETRDGETFARNGDVPYQVDASLLYLLGDHWELAARYRTAAGVPYTPTVVLGPDLLGPGRLNDARLPPTRRLDLRVAWTRRGDLVETRVYLELNNVLGAANIADRELDWDDDTGRFRQVDGGAMPRIPAFGVEIRWAAGP